MSTPSVAIFTCKLLPPSETFIRAQAEALHRYQPYYVGCRRVNGISLPADRMMTVNRGGRAGKIAEAVFKYTGRARSLETRLAKLRPKLIHAHFGPCGALAMPIAHRLGLPLIVTYHGADATTQDEVWKRGSHTHRIYLRRRPKLFRRANFFLAVSEFIRSKLIVQGVPMQRIARHYIGIDTAYFSPRVPLEGRARTVVFVGRLNAVKGCEFLIRAMRIVQAKHPDALLKIIGDGPLRAPLERLATECLHRCEFLGLQPPEVVRREVSAARVFSVPSITTDDGIAEGFGLVFVEAQAMGTPVVSSCSGGIPEAVADGRTGFLTVERDVDGLARAILTLIERDELWLRFSAAARDFVCERFDLIKQTRLLEDLYDVHCASTPLEHDEHLHEAEVPYAAG